MNVFNPAKWKKEDDIEGISDDTITLLDNRYINLGENVYEQNINNLSVVNHNIASNGKIYFATDNTTQTTAFIPSFVTNQINAFLSSSNKFTGQNIFTNLNIEDTSGNRMKIYQSGNNVNIENMKTNGSILFKNNGITTSISNAGRLTVREIEAEFGIYTTSVGIANNFNISRDGTQNIVFDNLRNGSEYYFKTKFSNGSNGWMMIFNPNGQLYGIQNLISHSLESKVLKFRDPNTFALTNAQIVMSNTYDMVFDNNVATRKTNMKFTNYSSSGVPKTIIFDENANISGVNDINMTGKMTMNNVSHQFLTDKYIIDNNNNGSSIAIRNRDTNGVLREINISPTMTMSGLNDLYCQRLYINNVLINFTAYNDMLNRTSMISQSDNKLDISTSQGQISLVPFNSLDGNYNLITKSTDAVIYFNNNNSPSLSIVPWTGNNTGGIRVTPTATELYKPKVMDSLTFSDNTVQSTAVTESYLTNFVNNLISQSQSSSSIPTGTILSYVGDISPTSIPSGYLLCLGNQVSQTTYANLFNVIGHKFLYGRTVSSNSFYLPDLQGAVLKGIGTGRFTLNNEITTLGAIQNSNVGHHKHTYSHHTTNIAVSAGTGNSQQTIRNFITNGVYTSGGTFHFSNNNALSSDNLVNSVGVNYIIKF